MLISFFGFFGFGPLALRRFRAGYSFWLTSSPTQFCFCCSPSSTKLLEIFALCIFNTLLFVDFLAYSSVLILLPWLLFWYMLAGKDGSEWESLSLFSDGKNSWA